MHKMVLARKWRPIGLSQVVGQPVATDILKNTLFGGKFHHAYLLTGTRGVGKTTIARIIAKLLNCVTPDLTNGDPCNECPQCQLVNAGCALDIIEVDAASNTSVDNIRDLISNAQYSPVNAKYKVYIIDEVHMLSKPAFNAMLKILEEPPSYIVFILATTEYHKIPATIISRCLQLKLNDISTTEIVSRLKFILHEENVTFEEIALSKIAELSYGSMRDALSLIDQAIVFTNNNIVYSKICDMLGIVTEDVIIEIIQKLLEQDTAGLIVIAERLHNQGQSYEILLTELSRAFCCLSVLCTTGKIIDMVSKKLHDYLIGVVNEFAADDLQLYFEIVNLGIRNMQSVQNKYSLFLMTLLRLTLFKIFDDESTSSVLSAQSTIKSKDDLAHRDKGVEYLSKNFDAELIMSSISIKSA